MIDFLYRHFNIEELIGEETILFVAKVKQADGRITDQACGCTIINFINMFSVPLQKAIDNGTDPMDEIRAFDPENKLGYNNLIV